MWKCICDLFLPALEAYSAIHFTGVIDPLFPYSWCYQSTIPILLLVLMHYSHFSGGVIDPFIPSYQCDRSIIPLLHMCVCLEVVAQLPAGGLFAPSFQKNILQKMTVVRLSVPLSDRLRPFKLAVCTSAGVSVVFSLYLPCLSTTCQSWGKGSWQFVHS